MTISTTLSFCVLFAFPSASYLCKCIYFKLNNSEANCSERSPLNGQEVIYNTLILDNFTKHVDTNIVTKDHHYQVKPSANSLENFEPSLNFMFIILTAAQSPKRFMKLECRGVNSRVAVVKESWGNPM